MRNVWISDRIIAAQKRKPAGEMTRVTGSAQARGENEYRGLPLAGPWGVAWSPPNAARAVVVATTDGGRACLGAVAEDRGLAPGELKLFSAGGAQIYLKNSGEVVINGQVFAAGGGA